MAVVATVLLVLAGCGSGGGSGDATSASASDCQVGGPPALHRRRIPAWAEKQGTESRPVVLGCLSAPFVGTAETIGFSDIGSLACVSVEDLRRREAHGEICGPVERPATEQFCRDAAGCITGYAHPPGLTELSGPLKPSVRAIRVAVSGKPVEKVSKIVHVSGWSARHLEVAHPFGFFAVFLRGCVPSKRVRIVLEGAGGARLGTARWEPPLDCTGTTTKQAG